MRCRGIATAQLHGTGHARALGVALGKVHHAVGHITAKNGYRAFYRLRYQLRF